MKATIVRLHSPDVDKLEQFAPDPGTPFNILVQAILRPADSDGEESFDFLFCNDLYIVEKIKEVPLIAGRNLIVLRCYNYAAIFEYINGLCKSLEAPSWQSLAELIGRYGRWEFEDYKIL